MMPKPKKGIKIECDGTTFGTKVIDIATNTPIPNIISIEISICPHSGVQASLTVAIDELNITVLPSDPAEKRPTTTTIDI